MKKHQLAAGIALASGMLVAPLLNAAANPFSHTELQSGFNYNKAPAKDSEGQCGEGKCGEGLHDSSHDTIAEDGKKCTDDKCDTANGDKKCTEGKCGEGKCGEAAGDKKCPEGKCGEGSEHHKDADNTESTDKK